MGFLLFDLGVLITSRQINSKSRTCVRFRINRDVSSGLIDNSEHRRQPEARTLAGSLGCKEGLEDTRRYCVTHSMTVVTNRQLDVSTGGNTCVLNVFFV